MNTNELLKDFIRRGIAAQEAVNDLIKGAINMHGTMRIMDQTGHSTITWDVDQPIEVDVAKATFDKLIKEGYSAFEVEGTNQQGRRITTFDPKAGKLMMVPQLRGG